jgi:hypothetical protein
MLNGASTSESRDWPGNRPAWERLIEILERRADAQFSDLGVLRWAVAVVGEDAAAPTYPSLREILRQLVDLALRRGLVDVATQATWLDFCDHDDRTRAALLRQLTETMPSFGDDVRELLRTAQGVGPLYSPLQGLLVRLPFWGFVSLGIDPGLLEARRLLRPHCLADGPRLWGDKDTVSPAMFQGAGPQALACEEAPVFYPFGQVRHTKKVRARLDGLRGAGPSELSRADFLLNLWGIYDLVLVGFRCNDPHLDPLRTEPAFDPGAASGFLAGSQRAVALIGVDDVSEVTPARRRFDQESLRAMVYYYPAPGCSAPGEEPAWDHGHLAELLEGLAQRFAP